MNQHKRILEYLRAHKAITSLDGLKLYPPIIRISNRCNELIQQGFPISKERVNAGNSHYTKYVLES